MASTGSSFDADNAGTIPEIIPIIADILKPKAIFWRVKSIEKSKKLDTKICIDAGANILVAGSFLFKQSSLTIATNKLNDFFN